MLELLGVALRLLCQPLIDRLTYILPRLCMIKYYGKDGIQIQFLFSEVG